MGNSWEGIVVIVVVVVVVALHIRAVYKNKYAQFRAQHTQNVCKELPLSCRYFPWIR